MKKVKTIGILTGGGDCPGLNAVIRAVAKSAFKHGLKVWGIKNGFGGLVENKMVQLSLDNVSGILPRGGTILGTTNRDNPFHFYCGEKNGEPEYKDMSGQAIANLERAGIQALVVIGGDGSLRIGFELGKNFSVVAVPKTIDNDIPGTERTFGFDTAMSVATEALDRLHTTAESHHRVMVLEVMGRYAGWIALHSGLAGGADGILIPEIPFKMDSILNMISERQKRGKLFSLIVIAEGAVPVGGEMTIARIVENSPEKIRLGGVGEKLAREIETLTGIESRCTVLGHLQRGGTPTPFDRVLSTRYGVEALNCILDNEFNVMVALQQNEIVRVSINDIAGKNKNVPVDGELVAAAKAIGISFGD
jgi:phosphofructokinase-like protein